MPKILPGETDLYAITDAGLSQGRSLEEVVLALLGSGIRLLQYREKKLKAGAMLEECRLIRRLTHEAGACFIVNDHVDLALLVDADGVHVGQEDLPVPAVRQLLGVEKIIGLSTHSPDQALAAQRLGADYLGVGPIFATQTKEDVVDPVGFAYLDWVCQHIDRPFVAIGGIKRWNVESVARHGARCCCLVSEFVSAPDIAARVHEVRQAMQQGLQES
jgi:thiamine-phosphate pyrophosphorylase